MGRVGELEGWGRELALNDFDEEYGVVAFQHWSTVGRSGEVCTLSVIHDSRQQ